MASPDVLQALGLAPLRLAATLLRPPALSGLPPALAELAGDPTARLDALLARVVAPPDQASDAPEEPQRHAPATAPVFNGRFAQGDPTVPPAPTQAFAQSPLLELLPPRRPGVMAAAPPVRGNEPGRSFTKLPAQIGGQQNAPREVRPPTSPNGRGPAAEQARPARMSPDNVTPLPPSPTPNGDTPRAPQAAGADAVLSGPSVSPAPDNVQQPGELRLVRGLNQLHSLLNASVRRETTEPTRPTDGFPTGEVPLPALIQESAATAHAAAAFPHAPWLAGDAPPPTSRAAEEDRVAALAPAGAEPTQPLDVERLLDELAERLEIEYLRTYGTSG